MRTTVTTERAVKGATLGASAGRRGPGGGGKPPKPGGGDEPWPPGFTRDDAIEPSKFRVGMWVGMASILMLFVSLTSAYVLRQSQGLGDRRDWLPLQMPRVLWLTTALLLVSSMTIEMARRALRRNRFGWFRWLICLTTLLGLAFLAGQLRAWVVLVGQGVYVYSHPHSSFFYILTSLHAIHLLGGIVALLIVAVAAMRLRITRTKRNAVDVTVMYWHFMDVLWVYLFVLLFFWKQ
ncbi:MAG TPA: cytochrome c oxidase subunit 3 [Blastocatellia bacterium]|nr:cytochrome c oxidase subunit 3 [Blastocatellia bacterium]